MNTLTLSSKFQVVIPKHIREAMNLQVGMSMQMVQYGDSIVCIPVKPMKTARGMFKGMDTCFERKDGCA
ncbi:MAG: AbrB/MazE/SpoVT family DNA-binding domain-containing protein [Thiobacillus sp.]|nr:AbrB/MazE/SpoVT family DNA-binding domain-containing protein [Thiobacillus sp.]